MSGSLPQGWSVDRLDLDRDLPGILAIDRESFANPWGAETYEWEARHSDVARVFVLRPPEGPPVAYCAAWLVFDELHINNLAVAPAWRRRGLGAALLSEVLARTAREGAHRATLEVRASNLAARGLYERFGFRTVTARRGYYTNPVEDALVLWREAENGP